MAQSAFMLFYIVHWIEMSLAFGNLDVLMFFQPKWRDFSKLVSILKHMEEK